MAPSFPRSTTASKWSLVFRVHIHPRYPVLIRFWFFSDVSVHTIEALGLAVERKKNSPRREQESISLLFFHSSVASPLCIDLSSYTSLFFPCHHCSILLVDILITITLFFLSIFLLPLLFSSYCLSHVFLPDNATSSFFPLDNVRLFVWCQHVNLTWNINVTHSSIYIFTY